MKNAYIFIDETGKADFSHLSTNFCLSAIVINEKNREKLKENFEKLKLKYFGSKSFVMHGSELRRLLRVRGKSESKFASDLKEAVYGIGFFSLCTVTNKEQAKKGNWTKETIMEKSYEMIMANLIKFVVAKDYKGQIVAEASAQEQDIHLYRKFFRFMGSGMESLNISSEDVKKHVTAVTFVTKQNEDCETQLADLLAGVVPLKYKIEKNKLKLSNLGALDKVLLEILEKKLFVANVAGRNKRKKSLYEAITSYKKFP